MGRAKDEAIRLQELLDEARGIAVAAGVLESCPARGGSWETGESQESAYKLGNHKFNRGELSTPCSRRELTDAIQQAIQRIRNKGVHPPVSRSCRLSASRLTVSGVSVDAPRPAGGSLLLVMRPRLAW